MTRYRYCEVYEIRGCIEHGLENLPASTNSNETAEQFWARVEKAGLLIESIALYDELAAQFKEWRHIRRESKMEFDLRMEREGRRSESERLRAELTASGLTQRQVQVKLVQRLQPLDGSATKAWETPDPWEQGRLFRSKTDHRRLLELTRQEDDEDYDEEQETAQDRLNWAKFRRNERQALANARRRAQALKLEQERRQREQALKPKPAVRGRKPRTAVAGNGQDRIMI